MNPIALLFKEQPYYQRFEALLSELADELANLTEEKRNLIQENQALRAELEVQNNGNPELFAHLTDDEKKAMREKVADLIQRVDKHISEQ